jgi:hypothetical protein
VAAVAEHYTLGEHMKWRTAVMVIGTVILFALGGLTIGLLGTRHTPQWPQEAKFIRFSMDSPAHLRRFTPRLRRMAPELFSDGLPQGQT